MYAPLTPSRKDILPGGWQHHLVCLRCMLCSIPKGSAVVHELGPARQARLEDHRRSLAEQALQVSEKDRLLTHVRQRLQMQLRFAFSPQMVLRALNIPLRGGPPPNGIATLAQVRPLSFFAQCGAPAGRAACQASCAAGAVPCLLLLLAQLHFRGGAELCVTLCCTT